LLHTPLATPTPLAVPALARLPSAVAHSSPAPVRHFVVTLNQHAPIIFIMPTVNITETMATVPHLSQFLESGFQLPQRQPAPR
jgi:hypothetical protein